MNLRVEHLEAPKLEVALEFILSFAPDGIYNYSYNYIRQLSTSNVSKLWWRGNLKIYAASG